MEFEDILLEVGGKGKYQKKLMLYFLLPTSIVLPWLTTGVIFMVSVPEHWCSVPEVVMSNLTIEQQRRLVSPPSNPKCLMYEVNYTDYLNSGNYSIPVNTTTKHCDSGWEYDNTYYDSTVATQWNMFCEDLHYTSFVLTMFNAGSMIFTPVYGAFADRMGRRIAFFLVLTITAVSSFASIFITDFTAFVVFKTINGGLMPCLFQIPFIIALELLSPDMRTHMNGLANCTWSFGLSFLPLLAYLSRSYVTLGLVTSLITLLLFVYWKFLPESPRWLVSQERYDEALIIMQKIAKENGKSTDPDDILSKLKMLGEKAKKEKTVDKAKNSSLDVFRYPQLRKIFIIITICWMADVLSYDGLQLNVTHLAGNEFLNFFLTSIVEIPGFVGSWILMDRYGRRWCTATFFLMSGTACILLAFVSGLPYADITCSMVGKFFASAAFIGTYQQGSELYPTVIRSLGMGMSKTVSGVISMSVPYVIYLGVYGKAIPFVIIGLTCIVAGISATFLPETLNKNLPQNMSDCEEFAKDQKYFSWNRQKKSLSWETRASLALQMQGLGNKEENHMESKIISQTFQNGDSSLNAQSSPASNEVEKKSDEMIPASEIELSMVKENNPQVAVLYRQNTHSDDDTEKENSEHQNDFTSTDNPNPHNLPTKKEPSSL